MFRKIFLILFILSLSILSYSINYVDVGKSPEFIKISPDGKYCVITLYGEDKIAVFDLRSPEKIRKYPCGGGPLGFDFSLDGRFLFIADSDDGVVDVLNTSNFEVVKTLKCGDIPVNVISLRDGNRLAVSNFGKGKWGRVDFLEIDSGEVLKSVKVGVKPLGIATDSLSKSVYVLNSAEDYMNIIDTSSYKVTGKVKLGKNPSLLATDKNFKNIYISLTGEDKIAVFNILRNRVIGKISCSGGPFGISVSGDLLGVTCHYGNLVRFFDINFNKGKLAEFTILPDPTGIAMTLKRKIAYFLSEKKNRMGYFSVKELIKEERVGKKVK